jgi:predicted GNAT family acetyltransferase
MAFSGARALRRRLARRAETGPLRATREAEQRLRNAEAAAKAGEAPRFYAEASGALLALLEARLEELVLGLTRTELRDRLAARGMEQALLAAVLETLERCEFARFSSGDASGAELDAQARSLQALYRQLSAFSPRGIERAA